LSNLGINYQLNRDWCGVWTTHTAFEFSPMIWEHRQRLAVAMMDLWSWVDLIRQQWAEQLLLFSNFYVVSKGEQAEDLALVLTKSTSVWV